MEEKRYDLEERLLEYATRIIRLIERLPNTRTATHVAGQLLRSGTAPCPHHGEAQAAESQKDFIYKMRLGLKELRESERWLKLIERVPLFESNDELAWLLKETDELIRIYVSSVRTAQRNSIKR